MVLLFVGLATTAVLGQQPASKISKLREQFVAPILPAEQAWLIDLPSPPSAGGVLDADRVYVPIQSEQTIAIVRETGEIAWTRDIESAWPPVLSGTTLIVAASDELHGLDAKSGETRWRVPLPSTLVAPMTVADSLIIVPVAPDQVLGVSIADGSFAWRGTLGGPPIAAAAITTETDGSAVFSLKEPNVVAIALADGSVRWRQTLNGALSPPTTARERVFVGSTDNRLYALDSRKGRLAWTWPHAGGDVIGTAADEDAVYVASLDNILRALNRGNGNQRWKKEVTTRPIRSPRTGAGAVWVAGTSPTLSAFAARTGAALGTFDAPSEIQGEPLVDASVRPFKVAIVVVTRDGRMIGLRPTGMMFREAAPVPLTVLPGRPLAREPARLPQAGERLP